MQGGNFARGCQMGAGRPRSLALARRAGLIGVLGSARRRAGGLASTGVPGTVRGSGTMGVIPTNLSGLAAERTAAAAQDRDCLNRAKDQSQTEEARSHPVYGMYNPPRLFGQSGRRTAPRRSFPPGRAEGASKIHGRLRFRLSRPPGTRFRGSGPKPLRDASSQRFGARPLRSEETRAGLW